MPRRALESIDQEECLALLAQQRVGRLVFVDADGPAALPVIYAMADGEIVFRSEGGSKITAIQDGPVAFEVDEVDHETHAGWSVLVRGESREVELEALPSLVRLFENGAPLPWKKGIHRIWVAITPQIVTGRRLADYAEEDFS